MAQFSPMDIDRLVTFIRAAIKSKRIFAVDPYVATIIARLTARTAASPTGEVKLPPLTSKHFAIYYGLMYRRIPPDLKTTFDGLRIRARDIGAAPTKFIRTKFQNGKNGR